MPIRSKQNKLELKQGKIQSPAGVHANKKVWDSRISPETFRRLDEGITLVAVSGYTKQDYVKFLMDKYGLSVRSVSFPAVAINLNVAIAILRDGIGNLADSSD